MDVSTSHFAAAKGTVPFLPTQKSGQSPHFLLFAHIDRSGCSGGWQFVLRNSDGDQRFDASDAEADISVERLELLTVVRALEFLDQPSRVTLVDCGDYVWSGVRDGLAEWRTSDWRWEYFGQMVPVKNADLWQRLDRAMEFHTSSVVAAALMGRITVDAGYAAARQRKPARGDSPKIRRLVKICNVGSSTAHWPLLPRGRWSVLYCLRFEARQTFPVATI